MVALQLFHLPASDFRVALLNLTGIDLYILLKSKGFTRAMAWKTMIGLDAVW